MKRLLPLLLIFVLALTSCGAKTLPDNIPCTDILNKVLEVEKDAPEYENLYTPESPIDPLDMSMIFRGEFEESQELGLIEDYAIRTCSGVITYEIDILKGKSDTDMSVLEELLKSRLDVMSKGDKAMYDTNFKAMMDSCEVYINGRYAILLVTNDVPACKKAIEELCK